MRKKSSLVWLLTLPFILFISSCQKELCIIEKPVTPPKPTYTIPGGWEGKFGRNADIPNLPFAAHFKTNGKATVEADTQPFYLFGNWVLTGDSIITNYTFPGGDSFRFAAKFADTLNTITGYWRAIPPATGGGNFFLKKN